MGAIAKGHAIGHLVIGAILLFCALLIIILSGVMAGKADVGAVLGPWWVGLMVMIPGILGVVAGVTKKKCPAVGFLVLSIIILIVVGIITALMAIVVAILAVVAEVADDCKKDLFDPKLCKCSHEGKTFDMHGVDGDCSVVGDIHGLATGVLAMMIISCLTCFAGSILGCVAVCCNKNSAPTNTTVIIQQGQPQMNGQQQPPPYNQPEPVKY